MQLSRVYKILESSLIILFPLYFISVNIFDKSFSILFFPFVLMVLVMLLQSNYKTNSIRFLIVNFLFASLLIPFYETFNFISFLFVVIFSFCAFNIRLNVESNLKMLYLIFTPVILFFFDSYFPFISNLSFVEYHHENVLVDRARLIFSEPSYMGLYYFILLMLYTKAKKNTMIIILIVLFLFSTLSISAIVLTFTYFILMYYKISTKNFLFILILGLVFIYFSPQFFIDRLGYLLSFEYFLDDYKSSTGNRLNSFFFLIEYYESTSFSWIGQGWNASNTFVDYNYSDYSFTDLGQGDIKNLISHFLYFLGIWGLYYIFELFKNFNRYQLLILILFCFSYNWLIHPFTYLFFVVLYNFKNPTKIISREAFG